jgi:hypothetical protein
MARCGVASAAAGRPAWRLRHPWAGGGSRPDPARSPPASDASPGRPVPDPTRHLGKAAILLLLSKLNQRAVQRCAFFPAFLPFPGSGDDAWSRTMGPRDRLLGRV